MTKRLSNWLQPIFVLIACALLFGILRSQWRELTAYTWRLHGGWLLLSLAGLLCAWGLEVEIWRKLLRLMGGRIPYWGAIRVWFLSAVVRYIPGNIWQPLSLALYCQRWRVQPEVTVTSIALYQAVILLAAAVVAAIYFPLSGNFGLITPLLQGISPWLMSVALLPAVLFLARPQWLLGMINWALRKVGRATLDAQLTTGHLAASIGLAIIDWGFWGISFAALTFSLGTYDWAEIVHLSPHLIAAYGLAYAVGFVSFITPSGFGVREGAFYLLLVPPVGWRCCHCGRVGYARVDHPG